MKILSLAMMMMLVVACSTLNTPPPTMGMSEEALIAKSGKPSARHQEGRESLLEYSSPWGQTTYMARIGADGRLKSWEQVLSNDNFSRIVINKMTKPQVFRTFGTPAEKSYLSLPKLEVWSYRYKEGGVQNLMMHVYFDHQGVVRRMEGGLDPMYDATSDRGRGGGRGR